MGGVSDDLADLVHDVRFEPLRRNDAYQVADVEDVLQRLEAVLRADGDVPALLRHVTLRPVRRGRGFPAPAVDRFLAHVLTEWTRTAPRTPAYRVLEQSPRAVAGHRLTRPDLAARLRDARFELVTVRSGYDMSVVDDLLDLLMRRLEVGERIAPVIDDALGAGRLRKVRLSPGYRIADVDRLLVEVRSAETG
ncbi:hypothetical protein BH11ACT8_BH11ACT8_05630 [soil metagenome]